MECVKCVYIWVGAAHEDRGVGERMRGLDLGFTNPVGAGGVVDVSLCLGYGGVVDVSLCLGYGGVVGVDGESCCCLPTPMTLARGGVLCSRLWSTSRLLRPSGLQCSHSGGVCPQIQGATMWCVCGCS